MQIRISRVLYAILFGTLFEMQNDVFVEIFYSFISKTFQMKMTVFALLACGLKVERIIKKHSFVLICLATSLQ